MLIVKFAKREISMRLLLATLALCVASACSGQKTDGEPPQETAVDAASANNDSANVGDVADVSAGEEKTIEDMRAESLAAIDKESCAAAGGEVRMEGMLGMYRCVKPYADAGKECRSDADCEGKCLATDDAMPDAEVVGACQANDSPFGCYAEVENGKITNAICVD